MNEFKTKLESVLRGDTQLQTILSKTASPWGIYFMKPPKTPDFPLIVYKLIGGITSPSGADSQVRSPVLQLTAYGDNFDAAMERVERIFQENPKFTGMTTCQIWTISPEVLDLEDFDEEFGCYARTDRYRVFLTKITG